ncbi:MAG: hypothetical protein PHT60_14845 [Acidiphilium sp.]|nr:hypothetical protein [Acidiphilium sp.]
MTANERKRRSDDDAPGIFRRGVRFLIGPGGVVPHRDIVNGAELIKSLLVEIRTRRASRRKIRLNEDGTFDLAAMAFDAALPVSEIERQMANRQLQTARNAKLYLGLGSVLLVVWAIGILDRAAIVVSGVDMVLFLVVIFCVFLAAFANALINWQVRTRRLGRVGEFLGLEGSWWPHER